jgi:hypothetical protein
MRIYILLNIILSKATFGAADIHAVLTEIYLLRIKIFFAGVALGTAPESIFGWIPRFKLVSVWAFFCENPLRDNMDQLEKLVN